MFFIDTAGQDFNKDNTDDNDNVDNVMVEDRVMGGRDAATEAKHRQRSVKERSLASFLFGNNKETSDAESVHNTDDDDDDVAYKLDDEDHDSEQEDEIKSEDDNEDNDEQEDDEEKDEDTEVTVSSAQPSLPTDLILSNKRKRKAAWVDEDDSKVLVKDVTATYQKAAGKHGLKVSLYQPMRAEYFIF